MLSGSGLVGAGGYVYWVARKRVKLGYPPGPGNIMQMVIGISESRSRALGERGSGEEKRGAATCVADRGAWAGGLSGATPNKIQRW